jgi:hypothetical protein
MLHFTRRLALAVAVAAAIWATRLILFGGVDAVFFGARITSNDPLRPLLIVAAALVVFVLAGGRFTWRTVSAVARVDRAWIAGGLALLTFVIGFSYATTTAGGVDAYGYVSEAELWLRGSLKVSQPWVADAPWSMNRWAFVPLAYKPSEIASDGLFTYVPICAPGLPLLMAGAKLAAGHCAMFAVVPLLGAFGVLATFGIGRRLSSENAGLIAAWLVATSPAFLFMLVFPMTDVAATGAWTVAFYCLLGSRPSSFAAAGAWSSVAILIRPNLAWITGVMGLLFIIRAWRDRADRWSHLRHAITFAGGVVPGVFALAAINQHLYGSPLMTGYGAVSSEFGWANVLPNLRNYTTWLLETETPVALLGVAALFVPLRRLWPATRDQDRPIFVVIGLIVVGIWAQYSAYTQFDAWWYLRFLLPCWPFFAVGLGSVLAHFERRTSNSELRASANTPAPKGPTPRSAPVQAAARVALVLALGGYGLYVAADRGAFGLWKEERRYVSVAALVQSMTDATSAVITGIHTGSLLYYGGRTTVRFDYIDRDRIDRAIQWMESRGMHVFVLLEESELPEFKEHFAASRRAIDSLERPSLVYNGHATVYLYDLTQPRDPFTPPVTLRETYADRRRCVPPAK